MPGPPAASRPPLARDPWAWAVLASVLPLVWRTGGTPRGEPVAEDFDFLHRALFEAPRWLDGGGSLAFWRPISHQLYYLALGHTMLAHPGWIAALHVALLASAALLVYRALRRTWPGGAAAAAAGFALMADSTRTLVCWPSHFVDLGAYVFLALAVHEAAARRLWSALAAALAALLCKELALVGVLLLPFVPGAAPRRRIGWLLGAGGVAVGWAVAYAWVRAHAGLELPHGLERDPALLATPLAKRLTWALGNSLRATFSLAYAPRLRGTAAAAGLALVALAAAVWRDPRARERWRALRGWTIWGAAWATLSWAALISIYPLWSPNRSQLGSVGCGIGTVALAAAAHPVLPLVLTGARLALFALAPGTPPVITPEPADHGAFIDYARLSRLQQLMVVTRRTLRERLPMPAHGTTIGVHSLPLSTEYAFGGAHAIQAWYGDPTLRWVSQQEARQRPDLPVDLFLDYQPERARPIALLDGAAVRVAHDGIERLKAGRWEESLAALRRADSLQRDRDAIVFLGDLAGRRSYCLVQLHRWDEAGSEARFALRAAREDVGARFVVAFLHALRKERAAALAQLDTLLAMAPDDAEALELRRLLRSPPAPR